MKTLHTYIEESSWHGTFHSRLRFPSISLAVREVLALWSSAGMATLIVLLSIVLVDSDAGALVGAGTWTSAFVFFAVAIDTSGIRGMFLALSGLLLLVLAWLQSSVSQDYTIASGILIAAWVSVWVFRRLK